MKPRGDYLFTAAFVAVAGYASLAWMLAPSPLPYWDVPLKIAIFVALSLLFPSCGNWGWKWKSVALLIASTAFMSLVWIIYSTIKGRAEAEFIAHPSMIYPLVNILVATPLVEEKLFRHLLFGAMSEWWGAVFAAVLVSAVFALCHHAVFVWAFIASLILCAIFRAGASAIQCALVHGCVNAVVMLSYLWKA